jgi:luciferase family oxidoreductase group 1
VTDYAHTLTGFAPLSVLDVAPVPEGSSVGDALRNSIDLAQHAERWGFRRYWVAEHHNMPGIASSSPPVLISHIATATSTIRVGAGGVMLPNHAPLAVAEQFGMLEAFHPGRIDLAIGRAPGTDAITASALRRGGSLAAEDFPDQMNELVGHFQGSLPADHPYRTIHATPALGNMPALWMLGSSDFGARAAGLWGLPYAFAHHFSPNNTMAAARIYRESFEPSALLDHPYLMIAVSVLCAPTDEEADYLAGSGRLSFLRLRTGRPGRVPSPADAAAYPFTPGELAAIRGWTGSHIVGSPTTVEAGLRDLQSRTGADELMITSSTWAHADRLRSYELVAEMFELTSSTTSRQPSS